MISTKLYSVFRSSLIVKSNQLGIQLRTGKWISHIFQYRTISVCICKPEYFYFRTDDRRSSLPHFNYPQKTILTPRKVWRLRFSPSGFTLTLIWTVKNVSWQWQMLIVQILHAYIFHWQKLTVTIGLPESFNQVILSLYGISYTTGNLTCKNY